MGIPIRLSSDFLAETLQARREYQDKFKVLKEKLTIKNTYLTNLPFRNERKINFPRGAKTKERITIKLDLQEILKGLL